MQNEEWEGFQSFAEESKSKVDYNISINYVSRFSNQSTEPEAKLQMTSHKFTMHKKRGNFKPATRRKISLAELQEQKKALEDKSKQQEKRESKRLSVYLEKPKNKQSFLPQKEQHIPIFRFPNMSQTGKIVYKGFAPIFASEYFNYDAEEQIRNSTQSMIGDSIRNSMKSVFGDESQLVFNSKFESGNLDLVRKLNNQYHLYLMPDTNTKGHRQWFYFTVCSAKEKKVRFIIHGFKKKLSLFQKGMKPYCKKIEESVDDWKPIGSNVRYLKEEKRSKNIMKKFEVEYSLYFDLALESDVTYCLASCVPYSYSFLKSQLTEYQINSFTQIKYQERVLCKSLMGLDVPLLTFDGRNQIDRETKFIIINARTHPGESCSSWVLEGLLQYLLTSKIAEKIIKQSNVVIQVIPMLNPDGVYMGNYRTGIMGIDYNRLFMTAKSDIFPQINALKHLVRQCKVVGKVDLYLDLHGHSINPGSFLYGPDPCFSPQSSLKYLQTRLKKSRYFVSKYCKVGADNTKTETSRLYFQLNDGIYALTCENSLGMMYKDTHGNSLQQCQTKDWKKFGAELIQTLLNIYEQTLNLDVGLPHQQLTNSRTLRQDKKLKEQFHYNKSKTDEQNLVKHIESIRSLNAEDIQLARLNEQQDDADSMNDSDNQSQNLSPRKQEQLLGIVSKIVKTRNKSPGRDFEGSEDSLKKEQFRNRAKKSLKGQCLGNFKQYRFGFEDYTLCDWYEKKRLLSVPRVLKTQKINQSYIIRKVIPKPFSNDLMFESIQGSRKLKTEPKQSDQKRGQSRLSRYRTDLARQRLLYEMQVTRKG